MAEHSAIEWTDATWNPVTGCDRISPGCANCYAKELHDRRHKAFLAGKKILPMYAQPFEVIQLHEHKLQLPLTWRKPRRIFVNSTSDLFHEDVPDAFIDKVFAMMALCPQHTFQVLTKRAQRMRDYIRFERGTRVDRWLLIHRAINIVRGVDVDSPIGFGGEIGWPIPNVWLGVSVENQHFADERIPLLLQTPAAIRFISAEPLLGPVNLGAFTSRSRTIHVSASVEYMLANRAFGHLTDNGRPLTPSEGEAALRALLAQGVKAIKADGAECIEFSDQTGCPGHQTPRLDWVIAGSESGADGKRRETRIEWARSLRDQCVAAGVPFFWKQNGGKTSKAGGRLLDGRTWDELPEIRA